MPHRLAFRRGKARDIRNHRLRDVVLDIGSGMLLCITADFTDHDDRLGIGIILEGLNR